MRHGHGLGSVHGDLLSGRKSTQKCNSPFFFSVMTIGNEYDEDAGSMILSANISRIWSWMAFFFLAEYLSGGSFKGVSSVNTMVCSMNIVRPSGPWSLTTLACL